MYIEDGKFSLWCDFIERDFLEDGLNRLIEQKIVNGATSNPSIFKNAFLTSSAYQDEIKALKDKDSKEIYEILAIQDIKLAAKLLKPLYKNGDDGFISIEVDPTLCDDAKGTIEEARKLYKAIGEENVMIKIPATEAGFEAMETLISEKIHINATLVFSPAQAKGCLDAFERGISNISGDLPQAVISVFVSRFDRKMDQKLYEKNIKKGLLGIFNATKIYHQIQDRGLKNVRTLFASTGVKGDDFVKDYYITNLLYENSINTAPLETIDAFVKTKIKDIRKPIDIVLIDEFFKTLKIQNIDIEQIYSELINEGIKAFKEAFSEILKELK